MSAGPVSIAPLRDFVVGMTKLVERTSAEAQLLKEGRGLMAGLLAQDTWLPADCARHDPARYQQFLLHCDPLERFSVVSFVWGPGQSTPIHNHTVWGIIGMLRGAEANQPFELDPSGKPVRSGTRTVLHPGDIELVSPSLGDIHQVANHYSDRVSISIHVYGANIGAVGRSVWDGQTGRETRFISGYSARSVPNLWDRSAAEAAFCGGGR